MASRNRVRGRRNCVAFALVAGLVAMSFIWMAGVEARARVSTGSGPGGHWTKLDPGPLDRRDEAASVWTGEELIIWGGGHYYVPPGDTPPTPIGVEGAAYDPVRRSWRVIAPSPIPVTGGGTAVAWSGREMLVWGTGDATTPPNDVGAAYDPSTDSWRRIAPSPLSPTIPVVSTWSGREFVVWGSARPGSESVDGAAYDPPTDSWRVLSPAPLSLNQASAVWTGQEMVVIGSRLDSRNADVGAGTQAMAYRPRTDEWRVLASPTLSPQASFAVRAGSTIIAWDYMAASARFDLGPDEWRSLEDLPLGARECSPSGLSIGEGALAIRCDLAALFDPTTMRWRDLDIPPKSAPRTEDYFVVTAVASTGHQLVFWGTRYVNEEGRPAAWAYTPSRALRERLDGRR